MSDRIEAIKRRRAAITPGGEVLALKDDVNDNDLEFIIHVRSDVDYLLTRCAELKQWVDDLQSGMYVNCVYCGHRYGPGETTPVSMADALKAHVEQCPEHPASKLKAELARLQAECARLDKIICLVEQDLNINLHDGVPGDLPF